MKLINFKFISIFLTSLFLIFSASATNLYNEDGDFGVEVDSMFSEVYNNDIDTSFSFNVINNEAETQSFDISFEDQSGWDIIVSEDEFNLDAGESKEVTLNFKSNSYFDYTPNVVSPDLIKIVQSDDYAGFFEFPVKINGVQEEVSLKFSVNIKPLANNMKFTTMIQNGDLSPELPLKFTIESEAISDNQEVKISVFVGENNLGDILDIFSKDVPYKIYQKTIPTSIAPGTYDVRVVVKVLADEGTSALEWYANSKLDVIAFSNLDVLESSGEGFFKDRTTLTITNNGNIRDDFTREFEFGFFKSLLFGTNVENIERTDTGVKFSIPLNISESKVITYSFNFLALWLVILVILFVCTYVYIRKNSNPLAVQTQLYDIQRVKHEGVRSVKVRIGFENIRESELDKLKITFRMPSYLQVKDNSFSLTEPKHVLKGDSQYKLIWDFKRFEKNDTRLLGFILVNKKGILGDVRIPDLEIEVKHGGKAKKYYHSFPVIKG